MKIILKESFVTIITYLQVTGRPNCDQDIILIMAADDAVDVSLNICFKQLLTAANGYAAMNSSWTPFQ